MELLRKIINKNRLIKQNIVSSVNNLLTLGSIKSLSIYSRIIILIGLCAILFVWLVLHYQITTDYDRTIEENSKETMNLAIAFEEHVRRIVTNADKDLLNLKQAYEQDGITSPLFAAYTATTLKDPAYNIMVIYDEHGMPVFSFIQDVPPADFSDRDYFQVHQAIDNQKLAINAPIVGRISAQNIIPLSRRINKADGSFGGIVYLGLRADYFLSFYQKIDLGKNQLIYLDSLDGFLLTRQSDSNVAADQDIKKGKLWGLIQSGLPSATFLSTNIFDGITRITSYRIMPDYPLIVAVGKSSQVALANFLLRKKLYIIRAILATLFIFSFCVLLISRHEITKKLTAANKQERDRLSSLINSISDEVWFVDTEKQFTLANATTLQDMPLAPNEIIDSNLKVLRTDGTLRPIVDAAPFLALQGYFTKNQQELILNPTNGELRYREISSNPVRDGDGIIIGSVSVVRDNTERKKLENELEKHRNHLQLLVDKRTKELEMACYELEKNGEKLLEQAKLLDFAHDYIIVRDLHRKIVYWNHSAEIGYGFAADEVKGQVDLLQTKFPIPLAEIMNNIFKQGHWEGELVHTRKDGKEIIVQSNQTLNLDEIGTPISILEINHDITQKKMLSSEIKRLDMLNIIGEMAVSIGHEVRNPLTTVRGYLQFFKRKNNFSDYNEQLETMIEELDRANFIITEFLSLAKNKSFVFKRDNLNTVITTILPLLESDALLTGHNLYFEKNDIPDLELDSNEIRQMLLNLVRNALEAMSVKGTITIKTAFVAGKVLLTVQDTGHGIPKEIFDKLGTPFVTTKDHGTGIGLPVCYRIADRHKAKIQVKTNSSGTTFIVKFNHPLSPHDPKNS